MFCKNVSEEGGKTDVEKDWWEWTSLSDASFYWDRITDYSVHKEICRSVFKKIFNEEMWLWSIDPKALEKSKARMLMSFFLLEASEISSLRVLMCSDVPLTLWMKYFFDVKKKGVTALMLWKTFAIWPIVMQYNVGDNEISLHDFTSSSRPFLYNITVFERCHESGIFPTLKIDEIRRDTNSLEVLTSIFQMQFEIASGPIADILVFSANDIFDESRSINLWIKWEWMSMSKACSSLRRGESLSYLA